MRALLATVGFAALCGCGNHAPTAVVQGTYRGTPFAVGDAVSGTTYSIGGATITDVLIDGATGSCERATKNQIAKNSRSLEFFIYTADALRPGTYTLGSLTQLMPPFVDVQVNSFDNSCSRTAVVPIDGSVAVTQADTNGVSGTFDLTFGQGDHLTGNFSAANCATLESFDLSTATCP